MGESSGVLLKEVVAFRRCPLIVVSLYLCVYVRFQLLVLPRK